MAKAAIAQNLAAKMAASKSSSLAAPTAGSVGYDATQTQLNMLLGGRTSTILTGYGGEDEDKLKTSKILLGGG